jgi:hypothetical protein
MVLVAWYLVTVMHSMASTARLVEVVEYGLVVGAFQAFDGVVAVGIGLCRVGNVEGAFGCSYFGGFVAVGLRGMRYIELNSKVEYGFVVG